MKLYGGIDLHSNNNVMAIVDERDRVVYHRTYAAILSRSKAGNGVWSFLRMRWRLN
jgi:hypothetical protein